MATATIYFSDGRSLKVEEGQRFYPVTLCTLDEKPFATRGESVEIWNHVHDGLVPSILDLLLTSEFFMDIYNTSVVYSSKSVTRVEG